MINHVIDTLEKLKAKMDLIQNLVDIQVATEIVNKNKASTKKEAAKEESK